MKGFIEVLSLFPEIETEYTIEEGKVIQMLINVNKIRKIEKAEPKKHITYRGSESGCGVTFKSETLIFLDNNERHVCYQTYEEIKQKIKEAQGEK